MEMKKLFLLILLLLTACSEPLYSGIVTDKVHSPAHSILQMMTIKVGSTTQIYPRWIHYPDTWYIWVQNGKDRDSWTVSEEYYDSVEVGDYIKSEQLQKIEVTLRKWIKDWEENADIYLANKDSENPKERQLAKIAKEQANKIADDYNDLLMKYGNMFGETLPEGVYAAIERIE